MWALPTCVAPQMHACSCHLANKCSYVSIMPDLVSGWLHTHKLAAVDGLHPLVIHDLSSGDNSRCSHQQRACAESALQGLPSTASSIKKTCPFLGHYTDHGVMHSASAPAQTGRAARRPGPPESLPGPLPQSLALMESLPAGSSGGPHAPAPFASARPSRHQSRVHTCLLL